MTVRGAILAALAASVRGLSRSSIHEALKKGELVRYWGSERRWLSSDINTEIDTMLDTGEINCWGGVFSKGAIRRSA